MLKNKLVVLAALPLIFIGCSKSSDSSGGAGSGFGSSISATFIDAPVKGLKFTNSASVDGVTGAGGVFSCTRGELINFSLAGFGLGHAACGEKIFIHDLNSNAANFKWEQAAALIQSFSVESGTDIDLSGNSAALDLSALTYTVADVGFETAVNSARTTQSANIASGSSAVLVAAATAAANTALSSNITLEAEYETLLTEEATWGVGASTLLGTLTSGTIIQGEEYCWQKFTATSSVLDESGVFKFRIDTALGHDEDSVVVSRACDTDAEANDECETLNAARLPKAKVITGYNFDQLYYNTISNDSEAGGDIKITNNISLTGSVKADADGDKYVDLNGVFITKTDVLTGPSANTVITCKYTVRHDFK